MEQKQYGKSWYPDGALEFAGFWSDGMANGEGCLYYRDGITIQYDGTFRNNAFHGFGRSYHSDGSLHYEGVWNQDRPHERGTYYFADGKTVWY